MEFANIQVFGIVGNLISCIVSTVIIFNFFDMQYERAYNKRWLYLLVKVFVFTVNYLLFHLQKPIVNLGYWFSVIILSSRFLYNNENRNKNKKILTYYMFNMSVLLAYALCQAVGGIISRTWYSCIRHTAGRMGNFFYKHHEQFAYYNFSLSFGTVPVVCERKEEKDFNNLIPNICKYSGICID